MAFANYLLSAVLCNADTAQYRHYNERLELELIVAFISPNVNMLFHGICYSNCRLVQFVNITMKFMIPGQ